MSDRKAIVRYPHRCHSAKCKGSMPDKKYGAWAYWNPPSSTWRSMPTCPACLEIKRDFWACAGPGNSYSRYASAYICAECGLRESIAGFFWRNRCNPRLIKESHRIKEVT